MNAAHQSLCPPFTRLSGVLVLFAAIAGGLLPGCASHYDRLQTFRNEFYNGDLVKTRENINKLQKSHRLRDQDVLDLDLALVELVDGHPQSAEQILRKVRDRFDHLEQKSLAEGAASMLADDNVRAYPGEDYERVLVRAFLALSSLMQDGGDAGAYALQITDKQQEIIDRLEKKQQQDKERDLEIDAVAEYKQVPLGPYLRAALAEESPLTWDDASKYRAQVAAWAPNFRDGQRDLQLASHEQLITPGHGVLYVFSLVGRGPMKVETEEIASQVALLVADQIVSATSSQTVPPTLAPIKVPRVVSTENLIDSIGVRVDGVKQGRTATILDIGDMAERQHRANFPHILGRAIARRVVKKSAIYAVKEFTDTQKGSLVSIGADVAGVVWEATESADTRCWGLLPDQVQVLRVELPEGKHQLELVPILQGNGRGRWERQQVNIVRGRNTYVLGYFPKDHLVGHLLQSGGE